MSSASDHAKRMREVYNGKYRLVTPHAPKAGGRTHILVYHAVCAICPNHQCLFGGKNRDDADSAAINTGWEVVADQMICPDHDDDEIEKFLDASE